MAEVTTPVGFFTDTSICIGCKACEVACKEWNQLPQGDVELLGRSYDNTGGLGASTWRHVKFVEVPESDGEGIRWLMTSDVCKHCGEAACLDVCPTGALFRTEFGSVVVQQDVCNGCGYCVSACPFGVIERRAGDGRAWKCTLCYDRLKGGLEPACAKACPTRSISFGPLDELRRQAHERLATLRAQGVSSARLYGHDPEDGVGGFGAFFLLLDEPASYGLPANPVVPTRQLASAWRAAALAASAFAAACAAVFVRSRR